MSIFSIFSPKHFRKGMFQNELNLTGAVPAGGGWNLDGNVNAVERYIGTNNAFDFPVRVNGSEIARFTSLGVTLFSGAVIRSLNGLTTATYNDFPAFYDIFVIEGVAVSDDDFMGVGFNLRSSTFAGSPNRNTFGMVNSFNLPFIQGFFTNFFVLTENRFVTQGVPAFNDDIAAAAGGLTIGMLYQTTGAGAAPLNVPGIFMIKQ